MTYPRALIALTLALTSMIASPEAKAAGDVETITSQYGEHPQQNLTLTRDKSIDGPAKMAIFIHGGGWRVGDKSSLQSLADEWAAHGWVAVNMNYRRGQWEEIDGDRDDGREMLADVDAVFQKYRTKFYVDRTKVIVYGDSAGGHLAAWLGSYRGRYIAGTLATSPTSNIDGAIAQGRLFPAGSNIFNLGRSAAEFLNYSESTEPATWATRVRAGHGMYLVASSDEWVSPNVHALPLCRALDAVGADRCTYREFPGRAHGGGIVAANPELREQMRAWADNAVGSDS